MKVIKRDGRKVNFDKNKVYNAIIKAFEDVDNEVTPESKRKATNISNHIESLNEILNVEKIQDIVELQLMNGNRKDVAKAYILYRAERTKHRERNTKLMKDISTKLIASDVKNQNANVDERSFGGRIGEASDTVLKQYALDNCMSDMAKNNHLNNEIYIHDLNSYAVGMHNCLTIPFDKLLSNGFNTRQTDVRPANSINTAFQLVAVIFQLQSLMQFGGVSASHLDWTMIPYVRKSFYKHYFDGMKYIGGLDDEELQGQKNNDMNFNPIDVSIEDIDRYKHRDEYRYAMDMTVKETYQAVEGMYHNLNFGHNSSNIIMNFA